MPETSVVRYQWAPSTYEVPIYPLTKGIFKKYSNKETVRFGNSTNLVNAKHIVIATK